jgi:hypothetical protein
MRQIGGRSCPSDAAPSLPQVSHERPASYVATCAALGRRGALRSFREDARAPEGNDREIGRPILLLRLRLHRHQTP